MGDFVEQVHSDGMIASTALENVTTRFQEALEKADQTYLDAQWAMNALENTVESLTRYDAHVSIEKFGLNVAAIPTSPAPTVPVITYKDFNLTLDYSESAYTSALLDLIKVALMSDINSGGTGLGAAVEAAIWAREAERDKLLNQDTKDLMAAEWSERGLPLPDGILAGNLSKVDIDYQNKKLDKSRAISEETRKLAIQNLQFSKDLSIKLEGVALTHFDSIWNRVLDVYKTKVNTYISQHELGLREILAKVETFKAQADVFIAQVQMAETLAQTEISLFNARIAQAYNQANIAVQNAQMNIEDVRTRNALKVQAMQSIAQMSAQMVASIYAGISASAHIQAGESVDTNLSNQLSESHNYPDETPAPPASPA